MSESDPREPEPTPAPTPSPAVPDDSPFQTPEMEPGQKGLTDRPGVEERDG